MSIQKQCPSCSNQTNGRTTPHTVKNGNYKCGLCGHETPKRTRVSKKARDMEDLIKRLGEAKDPKEYGYEGEMAMSQLKGIMMHAKQLHDMLEPDTDLPEWVQSKITLAYDYIQTAADYMSTEMNEGKEFYADAKRRAKADTPQEKLSPAWKSKARARASAAGRKYPNLVDNVWAARMQESVNEEEAPANAVGGGKVAGMGVGPQGEPGVGPKAMKKYRDKNANEAPKAGRKTLAMFMQGTK